MRYEKHDPVQSSWYTDEMPNQRSWFYAESKPFIHYGTTGFASAGFGVPFCMTVSCVALFPFNAGKSKASLLPPLIPFHLQKSCPSFAVQVSAPTHGCTFHPNSKVTFACEANLPVTSVIWYLGFECLSLTMPGVGSASTSGAFFLDGNFDFLASGFLVPTMGKSFQASNGV